VVIENCRFSTLSSDQEGGALLVSNSSLLIAGSHFEENNAEFGGAPWPVSKEFGQEGLVNVVNASGTGVRNAHMGGDAVRHQGAAGRGAQHADRGSAATDRAAPGHHGGVGRVDDQRLAIAQDHARGQAARGWADARGVRVRGPVARDAQLGTAAAAVAAAARGGSAARRLTSEPPPPSAAPSRDCVRTGSRRMR
jgi:hypothetical protein